MSDINSIKATTFTEQARAVATAAEELYWMSKHLLDWWYALQMAGDIPNTSDPIVDGNGAKPLTGQDVTNIVVNAGNYVADLEANSQAILNVFLKASNLPVA